MPVTEPPKFFYAVEPRAFTADRTYRVYVSEQQLAGAWIAGQVRDADSVRRVLGQYGWLAGFFETFVARKLGARRARETFYDSVDPFEAGFLAQDAKNFLVQRSDVHRMRFRFKATVQMPLDVGVVEYRLLDGHKRKLILAGNHDPQHVVESLRLFFPAMEISGGAKFHSKEERETPEFKRRGLVLVGNLMWVIALVLGAGYLAFPGEPVLALAPIFCAVLSAAAFFQAWRLRSAIAEREASPDDSPSNRCF
ncbi:MAG: hypothetical protein K2Y37_24675 [Pirellulales bacterium]|nr:hypothetical protein [Pirellulales bacterium]